MKKIAKTVDANIRKLAELGKLNGVTAQDVDQMVQIKRAFLMNWLDSNLKEHGVKITKEARSAVLDSADERVPGTAMLELSQEKFAATCDEAISEALNERISKMAQGGQFPNEVAQDDTQMDAHLNVNQVGYTDRGGDMDTEEKASEVKASKGQVLTEDLDKRTVVENSDMIAKPWTNTTDLISPAANPAEVMKSASVEDLMFFDVMQKISSAVDIILNKQASTTPSLTEGSENNAAMEANKKADEGTKGSEIHKDKEESAELSEVAKANQDPANPSKYIDNSPAGGPETKPAEGNVTALGDKGEEVKKGVEGTQAAANATDSKKASADLDAIIASLKNTL